MLACGLPSLGCPVHIPEFIGLSGLLVDGNDGSNYFSFIFIGSMFYHLLSKLNVKSFMKMYICLKVALIKMIIMIIRKSND